MTDTSRLDQTFHIIMERLVETGQAPHYTEIAAALGVSTEEGRKAVQELFALPMFPGWLYPNTDTITSFPPFNNLPTQYRSMVDGLAKSPSAARARLSAGLGWGWHHLNSLQMAGEGKPSPAEQKVAF